jgi:hypothetical protein
MITGEGKGRFRPILEAWAEAGALRSLEIAP